MKRFAILLAVQLAFMALFVNASAQYKFGIKAGGSLNVFGPAYGNVYSERVGYLLGLTSHIKMGSTPFYLKPEILYTYKDFKLFTPVYLDNQLAGTDVLMGLNYWELPLNIGYGNISTTEGKTDIFFLIYVGVQPALLQRQNLRFKPFRQTDPYVPAYKEFDGINDFNLSLNLGFEAGYKRFYFDLRFSVGVIPLYNIEKDEDTVNTTAVSVGYRLF